LRARRALVPLPVDRYLRHVAYSTRTRTNPPLQPKLVMAGFVPAIHVWPPLRPQRREGVDARDTPGHDGARVWLIAGPLLGRLPCGGGAVLLDAPLHFGPEMADESLHRPGGAVGQRTDRVAP